MAEPIDGIDSQFLKEIGKRDHDNENDNDKDSSFSSDSEIDKYSMAHSAGKNRLFGRQRPLHLVLGGGKPADIILWRNKQVSVCIFAGVTVIWLLFECVGYHLLTFVCHSLILSLTTLFLWSNLATFINVSPPEFPSVTVPEDLFVNILLLLGKEISLAFTTLKDVAYGRDLKKFLLVTVALWVVSIVSSWFSFLTLFYLVFVMVQLVPVLYEKHEDNVDAYGEKAWIEIKKQYAVLDEKFIQKLPSFTSRKDYKKQH